MDTNGLVAWWTADGNALDAAGSHSGTLSGGVAFAPGVQGQTFSFNGTDSYVQVPDAPDLHLTSALSLAFWAKRQRFGIDIAAEKGGDWTLGGTAFGVGLHYINSHMFYSGSQGQPLIQPVLGNGVRHGANQRDELCSYQRRGLRNPLLPVAPSLTHAGG